jgi:NAD(P)H dehydrogenase (quinone)
MSQASSPSLVVTGAAGQLGRSVLAQLLAAGHAGRIIATTRKPEALADFAARGVTVRAADFDAPDSLAAAFAGGRRLLLVSTDAVERPGQRRAQHERAIAAAAAAGVEHVVYTSAPNARPDSTFSVVPDHYWSEQALVASRLDFTVLRNNIYAELLLQSLPHAIAGGELAHAGGSGAVGWVSRQDCARAAAAALAGSATGRSTLDVAGEELWTYAQLAERAAAVSGRPVRAVAVTAEQLGAGLEAGGLPAAIAAMLVSLHLAIARGELAVRSMAVRELTGRAPTSVPDFLAAHRAALVGS